ncbi:alanine racemase C-terminal domain-containing protein [Antiquaquibacter soli]|uniref:alanine racemase n=1 Tax=Antiquaquibacter soli TaxID=3064523 RepID=UPI003D9C53E5
MSSVGRAAAVRRSALVDLAALEANLLSALEADPDLILDARADAYGHGVGPIIRTALATGVGTVRVSPGQSVLPGIRRSALMTVPSKRRLLGAEAYGVDGSGIPVLTLVGEVIAVKPVGADAGVSYGYTYRTPAPTTLALVALGYADGVPRLASNRASVAIGGEPLPLVGRIAMDQFVVDCGDRHPSVGDDAVLFGRNAPSALDWAAHTERSALDLTAGIGSRVERVYS